MSKIKSGQIKKELFDLYDQYAHSKIDRRIFLDKLSMYAVGGLTVPAILDYLLPKYAEKQQIRADDPRLKSEYINYASCWQSSCSWQGSVIPLSYYINAATIWKATSQGTYTINSSATCPPSTPSTCWVSG